MKKIVTHMNILNDSIAIDSPIRTIITPIIIGFLTYLYIPFITNFLVGLQGARVPSPNLMNPEIVLAII